MGHTTEGMLVFIIIIFFIILSVAEICSVLGIIFGSISCYKSKKYVSTKGLGNFNSVSNFDTAATVFMSISCAMIVIWVLFWTCIRYSVDTYYSNAASNLSIRLNSIFIITAYNMAIPIASAVIGFIAQAKYKSAKELNADIVSKKAALPLSPAEPMISYQAYSYRQNGYYQNGYNRQTNYPNQQGYYQNGYNRQTNNPYQQGYYQNGYNRQTNNPYQQGYYQNGYNRQTNYPNQQGQYYNQQNIYRQPNGYNNQYNAYSQSYQTLPQNNTPLNAQDNVNHQIYPQLASSDPTAAPDNYQGDSNEQSEGIAASKTITCPACGEEVPSISKFCTNCGHFLK